MQPEGGAAINTDDAINTDGSINIDGAINIDDVVDTDDKDLRLWTTRAVVDTITVAQPAICLVYVLLTRPSVGKALLAVALLATIGGLHLWLTRTGRTPHGRAARAVLAGYAVLTFAPMPYFGLAWSGVAGIFAAAALLVLRPVLGVPVAIAAMGTSLAVWYLSPVVVYRYPIALAVVSAIGFVLQAYGFSRLGRLVVELRRARDRLTRAAVAAERMRAARRLHEMLVTELTDLGARAVIARRMVTGDPEAAGRQLSGMAAVARRSRSSVRTFAHSHDSADLREVRRPDRRPPSAPGAVVVVPDRPGRGENPALPGAGARALRFATVLLYAVLGLWFATLTVSAVRLAPHAGAAIVTVACLVVFFGLQLGVVARVGAVRAAGLALGVQVMLVVLPYVLFGLWGVNPRGILAGACLLVLRPGLAWPAFAGILGVDVAVHLLISPDLGAAATGIFGTVIVGLATYALAWNARLIRRLSDVQRELEATAVTGERLRFARDVHDLLGLGMSAIALKSDLAQRLLPVRPDQASAELTEIVDISRTALADVTRMADGPRALSLADELRSAESILRAAHFDVRVTAPPPEALRQPALPPETQTLLATVLRESVTNVLKHSTGKHCSIVLARNSTAVTLEVINDGTPDAVSAPEGTPGMGLGSLAERVQRVGGTLSAGPVRDGLFGVRVRLAVRTVPPLAR